MARITVEDCTKKIPNRFELVVLASKRGKDISSGAPIFIEKNNDKNAVIALREIAADRLDLNQLKKSVTLSLSKGHATERDLFKDSDSGEEDRNVIKDEIE